MSKEEFVKSYLSASPAVRELCEVVLSLDQDTQKKVVPILTEWSKGEHKDIKELEQKVYAAL